MDIEGLVEGITDRSLLEKIVSGCGGRLINCFGLQGCDYIRRKANGFSVRSRHGLPLVVLADLMDFSPDCAPSAIEGLHLQVHDKFSFRFVVRELESWLIADREGLSRFLNISIDVIPEDVEGIADPKQALVNLSRRGRSKWAKEMFPTEGMSGVVGEGYEAAIFEFVANHWNVERAQVSSDSLRRAVNSIKALLLA